MFDKINTLFQFSKIILNLTAYRQKIISSNIANADVPDYHPLDFNFKNEINNQINKKKRLALLKTSINHLSPSGVNQSDFKIITKNSIKSYFNKNNINMNQERTAFIENSLKYQSQISFLNNEIKNIMNVIRGQ